MAAPAVEEEARMMEAPGKASTKAKNKYNSKAYDSLRIIVHKGRKPLIQAAADAAGESLNGYVVGAVEARMEREGHTPDAVEES